MKVLKSVNFRTKCKKKVEHKPTSKKQKNKKQKKKPQKSQAFKQAPGMKKWENGLIIIT